MKRLRRKGKLRFLQGQRGISLLEALIAVAMYNVIIKGGETMTIKERE